MITGRNLRPSAMALACAAIASFGFTAGTLKAREVSNQPGLREILTDLAAGRNVSARVSLPLTIGFFNGQTALYITPEVGVDPSAGASTVAAAQQIAVGFNANFIPLNFASLPGSGAVDDIFVFTNSNQGNVLASAPNPAGPDNTDTDYSPLWQVNLVSWVKGRPTVLTSQADISTAERFRERSENTHNRRVLGHFHASRRTVALGQRSGKTALRRQTADKSDRLGCAAAEPFVAAVRGIPNRPPLSRASKRSGMQDCSPEEQQSPYRSKA